MEEKERYEWNSRFDEAIKDNQTGDIVNAVEVLNKQDKQIKELKKENKELEIKLDKCGTELVNAESLVSYLENENQQLKQQLHDLPKKIVKDIEKNFTEYLPLKYKTGAGFYSRLNAILEMFGGEDE